jgi:hypothetical protein
MQSKFMQSKLSQNKKKGKRKKERKSRTGNENRNPMKSKMHTHFQIPSNYSAFFEAFVLALIIK